MSQFKIKAKVRFWGGIYFIRRTIYRRAKVLGFRLWMLIREGKYGRDGICYTQSEDVHNVHNVYML